MADKIRDTKAPDDLAGRSDGRKAAMEKVATEVLTKFGVDTDKLPNRTIVETTTGGVRIFVPPVAGKGLSTGQDKRTVDVEWLYNTAQKGGKDVIIDKSFSSSSDERSKHATVLQRTTVTGPGDKGAYMKVQGVGSDGQPTGKAKYYTAKVQGKHFEKAAEIEPGAIPKAAKDALEHAHSKIGEAGSSFVIEANDGTMVVGSANTKRPQGVLGAPTAHT